MPSTFGNTTPKGAIHKLMSHVVTEGFLQDGLNYTITFSVDFVASNSTTGVIGTTPIANVFATSHAVTFNALVALIAAVEGVRKVVGNSTTRVITIYPLDQVKGIAVTGFATTGGAGQPTATIASVDNRVKPGMPVEIMADGAIKPATAATYDLNSIGIALDKAESAPSKDEAKQPETITVALRGSGAVCNCRAAIASLLRGPVAFVAFDHVNGMATVTSTSVTVANQMGWAMDAGTNIGDVVRVLMK